MSLLSTVIFIVLACVWWSVAVTGYTKFEKECLDEHNKLRAIHGAPPLTLNANLNKFAQQWANHLARTRTFDHRPKNSYGENLYMATGKKVSGRTAVRSWYNEINLYRYGSGFSKATGHFTQLVWKGSKQLGCAVAHRGNSAYVVANYSPPGNYLGKFRANVLPPRG